MWSSRGVPHRQRPCASFVAASRYMVCGCHARRTTSGSRARGAAHRAQRPFSPSWPRFRETPHSHQTTSEPVRNRPTSSAIDQTRTISDLREALRRQPELAETRFTLASALYSAGEFECASDEYRALLRLQPDHAQSQFNLAVALIVDGQTAMARGGRSVESIPSPGSRCGPGPLQLGQRLLRAEELASHNRSFQRCGEAQPGLCRRPLPPVTLKQAKRDSEAVANCCFAARDGIARSNIFSESHSSPDRVSKRIGPEPSDGSSWRPNKA